jgi:two-component system LytT family response regulator
MDDPIKTVIIDDEPPARAIIREYLSGVDDIEIAAAFGLPSKAITYLNEHEIDLLFLDIQMPEITGFELIEQLETIPDIIFSTAYDQYAIRAFEINAVDYLLKPYTKERFMEALKRVRTKEESEEQRRDRIRQLVSQAKANTHYPKRMFVRVGPKIVSVDMEDVIWIKAEGDYSEIHTADTSLLCSTGLGKLEEKLDPERFMRVHRSYIITVDKIKNLQADGGGGFIGVMSDGSKIKVSRSRAEKIKGLLI